MTSRSILVTCAAVIVAGCAGPVVERSLVPAAPTFATGESRLTLRISKPLSEMVPDYVSPATKGMRVRISGPTKVVKTVGLVVSATGCKSSLMTLQCTLDVPLKPCPSKKACYTASVVTYDAFNPKSDTIPATAHALSADQHFTFTIGASNTIIPLTLEGIPASIAVIPVTQSTLAGDQRSGFVFPKCGRAEQEIDVIGVDADGGYIVGPGAPKASLRSGEPAQLAVTRSPSLPATFTLSQPAAPAYAFGNHAIALTAKIMPAKHSGGAAKQLSFDVTYSGDICGVFTEFSTQASDSQPTSITVGPDNALWFTEQHANAIGRITTAGSFTFFSVSYGAARPFGITLGSDGNLWFTEANFSQIGRITTSGGITTYNTTTASSQPESITTGPDGNLWFTELSTSKIGSMSTSGTPLGEYSLTPGALPGTITPGPDGSLWFTEVNAGAIGRVTTSGALTEFSSSASMGGPDGITTGPDGALWYAEYGTGRVGRAAVNGSAIDYTVPDGGPAIIVTGPDGALWFTEYVYSSIARITTSGVMTNDFAVPTANAYPYGIVVGPDGALWFTEFNGGKIGRLR